MVWVHPTPYVHNLYLVAIGRDEDIDKFLHAYIYMQLLIHTLAKQT